MLQPSPQVTVNQLQYAVKGFDLIHLSENSVSGGSYETFYSYVNTSRNDTAQVYLERGNSVLEHQGQFVKCSGWDLDFFENLRIKKKTFSLTKLRILRSYIRRKVTARLSGLCYSLICVCYKLTTVYINTYW